jgi:hypothetical protein
MAHALLFDRKHRIVLVRLGTDLTNEALCEVRADVISFVKSHGACPGILDFSAVETISVPSNQIVSHARHKPALGDQRRVFVAPTDALFGICRMFGAHRDHEGYGPMIVRSMAEAYAWLEAVDPEFQPVT